MSPRSTAVNAFESLLDCAASLAKVRRRKVLRAAVAQVWGSGMDVFAMPSLFWPATDKPA